MNEPWENKKKNTGMFFSVDFRDMEKAVDAIAERMFAEPQGFTEKKPVIMGFSMKIGTDGKPVMQRFGNLETQQGKTIVAETIEPLVNVTYEDKEICITAELPGVRKEDIDLRAEDENKVILQAKDKERPYHKEVLLNCKILPNSAKASFKNGILEARFTKIEEKGKIQIE